MSSSTPSSERKVASSSKVQDQRPDMGMAGVHSSASGSPHALRGTFKSQHPLTATAAALAALSAIVYNRKQLKRMMSRAKHSKKKREVERSGNARAGWEQWYLRTVRDNYGTI